ncbi:MAG: serine hydrolase [Elusimicrobia bacterium]|nr:serine hydrolase [Elusimicrobiota bacterium]
MNRTSPNLLSCFLLLVAGLMSFEGFALNAGTGPVATPLGQNQTPTQTSASRRMPLPEDFVRVARLMGAQISKNPRLLQTLFHPSFFQKISMEQLAILLRQYHQKFGGVRAVELTSQEGPLTAKIIYFLDSDATLQATITVAPEPPYLIQGLFFGAPVTAMKSFEELIQNLKGLPGKTNFLLAQLDGGATVLHKLNATEPMAIGSTFKLYPLAALVENRIPWTKILELKETLKSLPSGTLHLWPAGSPLTVHTAASKMIAESDNTAADLLIDAIGRDLLETLLPRLGQSHPQLNQPFLTTLEFFRLKSSPALIELYTKASPIERRGLLNHETRLIARDQIFTEADPTFIDTVEWFATAEDLMRLMEYFFKTNNPTALEILGINQGLDVPKNRFPYAGFKGGSEPGALNLTWLLKTTDQRTFVLTMGRNRSEGPIDENGFLSLAQAAIYLIPFPANVNATESATP